MDVSGSPESDIGSFECFQNYTAPEVFVQGLAGQINQQDVEAIIIAQKQMLQRFEKTNEMLSNCNSLSYSRFSLAQKELKKHTNLMHDMKKDLDNIFKRIRNLKVKISSQYPSAFSEAQADVLKEQDENNEDEEDVLVATGTSATLSKSSKASSSSTVASGDQATQVPAEGSSHVTEPTGGANTASTHEENKDMNNSSSCDSLSSGKISSSSSFDN